MGEFTLPTEVESLAKQPGTCLVPECQRTASRASGRRFCFFHDPSISDDEKLAARRLGGRRGAMTPAEAACLFGEVDLSSPESRNAARQRLMELRSVGRLTGALYRDLLAGLDAVTKDEDLRQRRAQQQPAKSVTVELVRFGDGQQEPGPSVMSLPGTESSP
jgi:hypothetical protein